MSESGKRGEASSVRRNDEQKMIQELKDVNMYEDGMECQEMIELLHILRESKDMAKPSGPNSTTNKTPEPQHHVHQPCHSQAVSANSSSILSQQGSMSPDLPSNQHNNTLSQEKHGDSPEESSTPRVRNHFENAKGSKEPPMNVNKARQLIKENTIETINENKRSNTRMNSQLRNEEKMPTWKINPWDFMQNAKDVPLKSRFRMSSDRQCDAVKASVNIDKEITKMSLHLQKVSDLCRSQRRSNVQSNSPWGTGIKVGTANGSLDKEAIAEETTEEAEPPDETTNHNTVNETQNGRRRRACVSRLGAHAYGEGDVNNSDDDFEIHQKKRKLTRLEDLPRESNHSKEANLNVSSDHSTRRRCSIRDDDYHWGNDLLLDSDEETINVTKTKKAKPSDTKKSTTVSSTRVKNVEPVSTNESEDNPIVKEDGEPICIDDSDEVTICDNVGTSQLRNRLKRSDSGEVTSSTYPRRIVPPNPRGKYSGIRLRKPLHPNTSRVNKQKKQDNEDDAEFVRTISRGRGKVGLHEADITEELENDDEEVEESSIDSSNLLSLRPPNRMRIACERLQAELEKDGEAALIRQQVQRLKEEEIIRKNQERVSQRVREEAEKVRLEELNEKRKLGFEGTWRAKMRAKEKQRQMERTELNPEGPRNNSDVPSIEVMRKNQFGMEQTEVEVLSDNRLSSFSLFEQMPCPICRKNFPVGEIEDHAASCEEYEGAGSVSSVNPMSSRIPKQRDAFSRLLKCDTCSNFTAQNGKELENHVTSCLASRRDGVADGTGSIVEVPNSPIRTVRKNSEQTDSEINYRGQFVPKTRSNLTGVKRKR